MLDACLFLRVTLDCSFERCRAHPPDAMTSRGYHGLEALATWVGKAAKAAALSPPVVDVIGP